jgi:CheY-like chemotaxis protein
MVNFSHDRSYGGLGIGLTLVNRLVELHGGAVEVFSEGPSCGTEFVVRLPVLAHAGDVQPVTTPLAKVLLPGSRRILVVDDDIDSAWSLASLLQVCGHEVVYVAHDGIEAVDAAEHHRPDVVLMDIGMPRMDGYEAARQIRAQPWGATMTLIAVSGWGQEDDRQKSNEAGFDAHLVKPAEYAALETLMSSSRKVDR